MQIKNSVVLLTALTAGSAVARLHGHERRHQHLERGVGDWVTAVIDGQTVSWQNTYAGPTDAAAADAPASTATEAAPAAAAAAATTAASNAAGIDKVANVKNVEEAAATSATHTTGSAATAASGFGGVTAPSGTGVTYCGNVGIPYGSNIIEITKDQLASYDYTITLDGSNISEEYSAYFWNSCTSTGALAGFFDTVFPLTVKIAAGKTAYVALDKDTQGGFVTAPSSSGVPRGVNNIVTGLWGEFGFATSINNGWSGFDVSAIQAQIAGQSNFPGLKITGAGQSSSITTGLAAVANAYTQDLAAVGGIGGNIAPGPVALTATLNFSG